MFLRVLYRLVILWCWFLEIVYNNANLAQKHLTCFSYEQADTTVDNEVYKFSLGKQPVKTEVVKAAPLPDKLDELLVKYVVL